jgi:hypothetical protein
MHSRAMANKTTTKERASKKNRILSLYASGIHNVAELARMTHSRPSYVANVLSEAEAVHGYFDLYTTTQQPMNIYSRIFANRLGFKTEKVAHRSINYIDRVYRNFARIGDRPGQHHALVMALTMFNRARWTRKYREANIFRRWLLQELENGSVMELPAEIQQDKTPVRTH